jgi:hypothetical protein
MIIINTKIRDDIRKGDHIKRNWLTTPQNVWNKTVI